MKKEYLAPEIDIITFSFESILDDGINVSFNEQGNSGHNDDNEDDWGD